MWLTHTVDHIADDPYPDPPHMTADLTDFGLETTHDKPPHVRTRVSLTARGEPRPADPADRVGWVGYSPERDTDVYCHAPASTAANDHIYTENAWALPTRLLGRLTDREISVILIPETSDGRVFEYHHADFDEPVPEKVRHALGGEGRYMASFADARVWDLPVDELFIPTTVAETRLRRDAPTVWEGEP